MCFTIFYDFDSAQIFKYKRILMNSGLQYKYTYIKCIKFVSILYKKSWR